MLSTHISPLGEGGVGKRGGGVGKRGWGRLEGVREITYERVDKRVGERVCQKIYEIIGGRWEGV